MLQQHPITPPPKLVRRLRSEAPHGAGDAGATRERQLVIAAYRAGADAELDACCEWVERQIGTAEWGAELRRLRRPKPPSLAEQGQRILVENGSALDGRVELDPEDVSTIRAALKRLQELENNG